jgi:type IV pilus assembly protein PilX
MMIERKARARGASRSAQGGIVLFVALIVLVIMALTGLAMIRNSNSGLSIAGNLGMRQNALSGADLGTEAAMNWWLPKSQAGSAVLNSDDFADGYFSDWGTTDATRLAGDPSKYDWSSSGHSVLATFPYDDSGNQVRYIIERMCAVANTAPGLPGQECVQTPLSGGQTKEGSCADYPNDPLCKPPLAVFFRVSSQVIGPRNSVSYIQVMVVPSS